MSRTQRGGSSLAGTARPAPGTSAPKDALAVTTPAKNRSKSPFDILAHPNVVKVPRASPFIAEESDANAWGIPTVLRYLKDVIELPQYEGEFIRFEVTGFAFLCLAKDVIPQLNIQNNFHAAKIALHADKLRQKVFDKAAVSLPAKIEEWNVVHVGAWLAVHMGLQPKGLKALRNNLDGMKLLEMSEEQLQVFLNTTLDDDLSSKMHSLIETGRYGSQQVDSYLGNVEKENRRESSGHKNGGKKKKSKTLMSDRINKKSTQNTQHRSDSELDFEVEGEDRDVDVPDSMSPPPSYDSGRADGRGTAAAESSIALKNGFEEISYKAPAAPVKNAEKSKPEQKSSSANNQYLSKTVTFLSPEKLNLESRPKGATTNSSRIRAEVARQSEASESDTVEEHSNTVQLQEPPETNEANDEPGESVHQEDARSAPPPRQKQPKVPTPAPQPTVIYVERKEDDKKSRAQEIEHAHNSYLTEVIGHVVESNKATVGTLQKMILQLSEEKRLADEELMKSRAASLDSSIALGLLKNDKDSALEKIESLIRNSHAPRGNENATMKTTVTTGKNDADPPASHDPGLNSTTNSLIVLPEKYSQNTGNVPSTDPRPLSEGSAQRHDQSYRTHVDTATPKKIFLGDDYNISMEETMLQQAVQEKKAWIRYMDRYTNMEPVGTEYNESRMILSETAVVWIKVGNLMLRDSAKSVDAADAPPKDVQRCLLGLRKCISNALSGDRFGRPSSPQRGETRKPWSGHTARSHSSAVVDKVHKTQKANRTENVSELAVGMVYALGLVKKIMSRYPSRADTLDLSFLLRKARHGDLPISELSREDMRALLEDFLNIDYSKWHKLEAVCQLLDPDRNGFVDLPQVLRSFHSLCPLVDSIHDKSTAQRLSLIVLTIACEDMSRRNMDLNRLLSDVILQRRNEVSSFNAFTASEAFTGSKTKSECDSSDVTRMQDIEVIADLLFEFTAHFFEQDKNGRESLSMSLPVWPMKHDPLVSPTKKHSESQRSIHSGISSAEVMTYLSNNLRAVCTDIARSFRIYSTADNSVRRPVLTSVATLFVTYMCFRRSIMIRSASSADSPLASFISHRGDKTSAHDDGFHPSVLLLPQQALVFADKIEKNVNVVLGSERAAVALGKADSMPPEDFELVMAQLLGIPIPIGRGQDVGLALSACQLDVESFLADSTGLTPRDGIVSPPQRLDTRSAGRVRRTVGNGKFTESLHTKIENEFDRPRSIARNNNLTQSSKSRNEFDRGANGDSIEQIDDYLVRLNRDAVELKGYFDHLLKLKDAATLILQSGSTGEPDKKNDINTVLNAVTRIYKRLDDATTKLNIKPPSCLASTRSSLLEGLIDDPQGTLQQKIDRVFNLEAHLERGKVDALKLCGFIVSYLR